MSWPTAIDDFRANISDRPDDRLRWMKKCLGVTNGVNRIFKTFEKRRVSALVGATAPIGVYVNEVLATVDSEDLITGQFVLHTAPSDGDRVVAVYYAQWFTDAQIGIFLVNASHFLGYGDDYTQTPLGLQPAVLMYAASKAYQELAVRFADPSSDQFRFEELPAEDKKVVIEGYMKMSSQFYKEAMDLRKGYYTRQNQADAPVFDTISGTAHNVEPNS